MAREAVADYYRNIEVAAIWVQKETEAAARKQDAVDRFNAWDGRIETEGGAE
ncbi:hypothetical protein NSS79_10385 [Paenibacillus sp. FSL L8-0436]|uniref:hypothetical protein n=1 Tax=Paenibacillus sp. FSL L8-0436 TaxID=2954686 RepID=UPI0031595962